MLSQKNIKINEPDQIGYTALWYACSESHIEIIKLLVSHGADVNYEHRGMCRTCLYKAVLMNNVDVASTLLSLCQDEIGCYYNTIQFQYMALKNIAWRSKYYKMYHLLSKYEGKLFSIKNGEHHAGIFSKKNILCLFKKIFLNPAA